jgi:hypothetical protein
VVKGESPEPTHESPAAAAILIDRLPKRFSAKAAQGSSGNS